MSVSERASESPDATTNFGRARGFEEGIAELRTAWRRRGKEDDVSTDAGDLEDHGVSAWSYHGEKKPSVVVWVES